MDLRGEQGERIDTGRKKKKVLVKQQRRGRDSYME